MEVGGLAFPPAARGAIAGAPLPMSAYGPTSSVLPGDLTPEAYDGPLEELGWKGQFKYDDPEVVALRVGLRPRPHHRALLRCCQPAPPAAPGQLWHRQSL